MVDALKNWIIVIATLTFVSLYASALLGWIRPLSDITIITRLEPMIFAILGYYFGRSPAQATERTLKEELDRQTKRADAAQQAREMVLKEQTILEEKTRNAKVALMDHREGTAKSGIEKRSLNGSARIDEILSSSVNTALRILDS